MSAAHIFIYGKVDRDLVNSIEAQLNAAKNATELIEHYGTQGGVVEYGFEIKDLLVSQNKPRTAIAEKKVMSIGTIPFLSADKRQARESIGDKKLMIHNPWYTNVEGGDAEKMENVAEILRKMQSDLANDYAASTNLSKDEALAMMKVETYLSLEKAIEIGFIHEVIKDEDFKAVALLKEDKKQNNIMPKQITKEEAENLKKEMNAFQKAFNSMKEFFNGEKGENFKALVVQDANGTEIDFYELEDEDTPSIGDKANVDGSPASGDYVMNDGNTYSFTEGELTEIKEPEEEEEESEEMQNLKSENEKLQEEIKNLKSDKQKLEKENESFSNLAKETETKFNAMQSAFKDAGLNLEKPEGKKEETDKPKARQLFKEDK